jgi:hypothetical protein
MFTPFQHPDATDPRQREIARLAASITRQRLSADTANMSAAELRGYVRAYAQRVVRDYFAKLTDGTRNEQPNERLLADVVEQTVHLVVREFTTQPAVSIPAPHVQSCRAA